MLQNGTTLVRAMGRWSLAALAINTIIASGIFGLPSSIAGQLGRLSPWGVLLAGAGIGTIMACFAEVASRFTQAGGPYLYARVAFGRLAGIEMAWMLWLVRITAPAANANLFLIYLGEFWPRAKEPLARFAILTLLLGVLALINVRGVRAGARTSNVFTVSKLVPLLLVGAAGAFYLLQHGAQPSVIIHPGTRSWMKAILLLVFAYGGFEAALTPMGEAQDPRRDAAFAVFTALVTCTFLYTLIQWVVVGVLPDAARSERPLADVARTVLGPGGAAFIAVGALISTYGNLSSNMLIVPRITFALAENGDFPNIFAAVHRRFRTPYFSIWVFAWLTWLLALFGSFSWNVTLSAVARLSFYAAGCAALPVLRRKQPGAALFKLPGGPVFAVLGILICLVLMTQIDRSGSLILLAFVIIALVNWIWVRRVPALPAA